MAKREISWIKKYARLHPVDLFRQSSSQENPDTHVELLERYLKLIPHFASILDFTDPAMLHMDLHPGNIFVQSVDQPNITSIIDWQGTDICPLYLTSRFPRIVDYDIEEDPITLAIPPLPDNFDKLEQEQKQIILEKRSASILKKYWLGKTIQQNMRHAEVILAPGRELFSSVWSHSGGTWDDDVISFRQVLMAIVEGWQSFGLEGPCPVSFSEDEIQCHTKELEEYNDKTKVMVDIINTLGISRDGRVSHERFSAVKAANEEWKREIAIDFSEGNEELRDQWEKWWPFSDATTSDYQGGA